MEIKNIYDASSSFEVLQTTHRSQTAAMTLEPGEASSEEHDAHPHSDQVLIVFEGEVSAEIGEEKGTLHPGDVVIVPAGVMHRFRNVGSIRAVTFSAYAPPAYGS